MNEYTNPLKILWNFQEIRNDKLVCCEINPTNICTQDCEWCFFKEYRKKNPVSMPIETMITLLSDLSEMGCKSVIFSGGGEPLCHPNIQHALWYAKGLGLKIGLITNGDKLNKEMNDVILHTCDWVKISINSIYEDSEKLVHIKDLIKRRRTIVSISTFDESIIKGFKEEGVKPDFFTLSEIRENKPQERDYNSCHVINSYTSIGPDCNAYLCCSHLGNLKKSYGNIKKTPLPKLWMGRKRRKILKQHHKCPPCRFDAQNETIDYFMGAKPHKEFI